MIKSIFSNRIAKITVDILLVTGIFISFSSAKFAGSASWASFHCIASMAWYALILVHIWQHWRLTKAFVKPKVMIRNKVTFMAIVAFVMMTLSVIPFVFKISDASVHRHHQIGHLFAIVMLVHTIQKTKHFAQLFKLKKKNDEKKNQKLAA